MILGRIQVLPSLLGLQVGTVTPATGNRVGRVLQVGRTRCCCVGHLMVACRPTRQAAGLNRLESRVQALGLWIRWGSAASSGLHGSLGRVTYPQSSWGTVQLTFRC